jgi:2-polyprenyl-3-methyl-5-hydroxy-6-metoxy-1,4-benzoquinol methylase
MGDDEAARKARIEKYDRGAGSYSAGFVDPAATARRQVSMLSTWGTPLATGARVLELGCADGMITETLVRSGFEVTAVDFSPAMIDRARDRLRGAGLYADLRVAEVSTFEPDETYDAVLGLMRTFFAYVEDPVRVLTTLAACTRTKLLVDVNPRNQSLAAARRAVREAGFGSVDWRPFFVPSSRRVGRIEMTAFRAAERVPGIRDAILRRKFNAVVKGER